MDKSYRIKANVGQDQVLNVNLRQDIDLYEILSLKIGQNKMYKTHSAGYGVIVGRVLANDAFGVPNARVSVFIPLSAEDSLRSDLTAEYPFKSATDYNGDIRYNTLPIEKKYACYANVGTFPNKELVLDDDLVLEIFDKYYKFTTTTNDSGDYMIFGVPVGSHVIHVDVDLSNIGLLSQSPRDFIYKGYPADMFESPSQFKKSTNLDNLPQIFTENTSVYVYPFWGDKEKEQVAITRKDIKLNYKFEPTCVFLGSVMTDNGSNSIGYSCIPDEHVGDADQLEAVGGTIEMIRKRPDDVIEEFPIKGNKLIDGDGVFCYQIPMNLDFIGTDEYGNICPTDNPEKGIPTRASVRFRFSVEDDSGDASTNHTAKYLVPNNPELIENTVEPKISKNVYNSNLYEFGTLTPDDCFRDLYWNKIYSVKSYIPRIQVSKYENTANYFGIKGVNKKGARNINPIPYNKINLNFSVPTTDVLQRFYDNREPWFRRFWGFIKSSLISFSYDSAAENILEETDGVGLDFYNDWLNGCLYFPSWNWSVRLKKKYKKNEDVYDSSFCECKGEKTNEFFLYNNCSLIYDNNELQLNSKLPGDEDSEDEVKRQSDPVKINDFYRGTYHSMNLGSKKIYGGVIKKNINKDGGEIYYYAYGSALSEDDSTNSQYFYARLFSTDIILLGSFNDCDIDGVPQMPFTYPSTTSLIPPMGANKKDIANKMVGNDTAYDEGEENLLEDEISNKECNGMNWGYAWLPTHQVETDIYERVSNINLYGDNSAAKISYDRLPEFYQRALFGTGLFFGLRRHKRYHGWAFTRHLEKDDMVAVSDFKTCVNVERLCELGVINDSDSYNYYNNNRMDGLITKKELQNVELRSLFATLNSNKLIGLKGNDTTGYKTYNLLFTYPSNFDGRLENLAPLYTSWGGKGYDKYKQTATRDLRSKDYLDFRFGSNVSYAAKFSEKNVNYGGDDAGRSGRRIRAHGSNDEGKKRTDINSNGVIITTYNSGQRYRHFYGFKTMRNGSRYNGDNVYPYAAVSSWDKHMGSDITLNYTFPLYNNSFYFYFGLNRGRTAIDKFYNEFYSDCETLKNTPFIVDITMVSDDVCSSTPNGSITINVDEISTPYKIELFNEENNIVGIKENINIMNTTFSGLTNGYYMARITDSNESYIEEDASLPYNTISLNYSVDGVKFNISAETSAETSCQEICNSNDHGTLTIDGCTIDNTFYQTTGITKIEDYNYELGLSGLSSNVKVILEFDGSFSGMTCEQCDGENYFCICEPGIIESKVKIMCDGNDTNIYSYNSIIIDALYYTNNSEATDNSEQ